MGEDAVRDMPKGENRLVMDMNRPEMPRRRFATCSFH